MICNLLSLVLSRSTWKQGEVRSESLPHFWKEEKGLSQSAVMSSTSSKNFLLKNHEKYTVENKSKSIAIIKVFMLLQRRSF